MMKNEKLTSRDKKVKTPIMMNVVRVYLREGGRKGSNWRG